ncbi:MAG: fibronectin type III domain-containing protein [Phycisphaerales bacterium]|nr:fibronectin type III domain-containing protein [Phycisphaerales bacterium]
MSRRNRPNRKYNFLETLEARVLLSVSATEFNTIKSLYPDLALTNFADYTIHEVGGTAQGTGQRLFDFDAIGLDAAIKAAEGNAATTSTLIVVRTSTTQNTITLLARQLEINLNSQQNSLTIVSLGTEKLTIDADQRSRVLSIASGSTVALGGLVITGGQISGNSGGGIYNAGTLLVLNCIITNNNSTTNGGGIANAGKLTVSHSQVVNNRDEGIRSAGQLIVKNSTIANNRFHGIIGSGYLIVTDSTITSNSTSGSTGHGISFSGTDSIVSVIDSEISNNNTSGINLSSGTATVTNCTISSNGSGISIGSSGIVTVTNSNITASSGRGISSSGILFVMDSTIAGNAGGGINVGVSSFAFITNSLIVGNRDNGSGAGIYISNSSATNVTLVNCTIAGNYSTTTSSSSGGGGIYLSNGTLTLKNTIIANNFAAVSSSNRNDLYRTGGTINASHNLISDDTILGSYDALGNLIGTAPRFVSFTPYASATWTTTLWQTWDLRLAAGSPAINAGNNELLFDFYNNPLQRDLDRKARIAGETVDMGAYESSSSPVTQLARPTNVIATDKQATTPTLMITWNAVPNASGYIIQYSTNRSFTSAVQSQTVAGGSTTSADSTVNLAANTRYYVRVIATGTGSYVNSYASYYPHIDAATPMIPPVITATVTTATSITLGWTAQSGLSSYTLQYRAVGTETWTTRSPAPGTSASSITVSGLTSSTQYEFRLTANTADGSAPSEIIRVWTNPIAPQSFTSTATTPNSVALSWTAQAGLTSYTLQYRISGTSTWTTWTPAPGTSATSATITGLDPSTLYNFQLIATNASGSATSTALSVRTPPEQPANFISTSQTKNSISLSWIAQPGLTSYTLQYRESGTSTWITYPAPGTSTSTATVANLKSDTLYDFQLTATNASGSASSTLLEIKTLKEIDPDPQLPTSPQNFSPTNLDTTSITLSWNAQSNLTSYTLQYRENGTSTWQTWTPAPGTSATTATVTNLTPNTTYTFQLTATNADGSASSTTNGKTLDDPDPDDPIKLTTPTNGTPTSPNSSTISVNWTAVSYASGYIIQYTTDQYFTQNVNEQTIYNSSTQTVNITGLNPSTTYYVRVMATGTGNYTNSDYSTSYSATTQPQPDGPVLDPVKATGVKTTPSLSTITITWDANARNAAYLIVCTSHSGVAPQTVTGTSVTFNSLQPGTAYKFTVVAMNAAGKAATAVKANAKTPKYAAVKMAKATSSLGSITLNWKASTIPETTGYEVYRVDTKTKAETLVWSGIGINNTSATITGLTPATKYSFVVRAVQNVGGNIVRSAPAKASAATAKYPATKAGKTTTSTTSITLTWNPSTLSETTGYEIYRVDTKTKTETLIWTGSTTFATIDDLIPSTKYTFLIRAVASSLSVRSAPTKVAVSTAKFK